MPCPCPHLIRSSPKHVASSRCCILLRSCRLSHSWRRACLCLSDDPVSSGASSPRFPLDEAVEVLQLTRLSHSPVRWSDGCSGLRSPRDCGVRRGAAAASSRGQCVDRSTALPRPLPLRWLGPRLPRLSAAAGLAVRSAGSAFPVHSLFLVRSERPLRLRSRRCRKPRASAALLQLRHTRVHAGAHSQQDVPSHPHFHVPSPPQRTPAQPVLRRHRWQLLPRGDGALGGARQPRGRPAHRTHAPHRTRGGQSRLSSTRQRA